MKAIQVDVGVSEMKKEALRKLRYEFILTSKNSTPCVVPDAALAANCAEEPLGNMSSRLKDVQNNFAETSLSRLTRARRR